MSRARRWGWRRLYLDVDFAFAELLEGIYEVLSAYVLRHVSDE